MLWFMIIDVISSKMSFDTHGHIQFCSCPWQFKSICLFLKTSFIIPIQYNSNIFNLNYSDELLLFILINHFQKHSSLHHSFLFFWYRISYILMLFSYYEFKSLKRKKSLARMCSNNWNTMNQNASGKMKPFIF